MDNWIEIISFIYPHEAHMAKGILESEGIEVLLKDELTAQVNNFYSNAIGGVKLQVKEPDLDRAKQLLLETGYIKKAEHVPYKFWTWFNRLSRRIPFIGGLLIEMRLIIVITFLLMTILLPIVISSLPNITDKLTGNSWCVFQIYYKGQAISPTGLSLNTGNCYGTMQFRRDSIVYLPGIDTYIEKAHWELRSDGLVITPLPDNNNYTIDSHLKIVEKADSVVKSVYHGTYQLEIRKNMIKIQSDDLIILGEVY